LLKIEAIENSCNFSIRKIYSSILSSNKNQNVMAILDSEMGGVNENNVSPQQVIIKYGLIAAAATIITTLLSNMMGLMSKGMGTMLVAGLVSIGIWIFIMVSGVKEHRDQQLGGLISFKRVFLVALGVMLISGIIGQIFNYVYMNFINPNAATEAMEASRAMMEKMNLPEEAVDKAIEEGIASLKSPMSIIKGIAGSAIGGAIVGAIMGAIMKKEPPRPF
jgi:Protein of unknown function (DUF4199)